MTETIDDKPQQQTTSEKQPQQQQQKQRRRRTVARKQTTTNGQNETPQTANENDGGEHLTTYRLHVLESEYRSNPARLIYSMLGNDIKIKNVEEQNYYENGYLIVDVTFVKSLFNPIKLYFAEKSKLKPLELNTNKYIAEINKTPVCITVPRVFAEKFKNTKYYPIKIRKIMNNPQYKYYGIIQDSPMNNYASIINYTDKKFLSAGADFEAFTASDRPYEKKYKKDISTQEEQYKSIINGTIFTLNTVKKVKKFSEIDIHDENTGYVIDVNELKPELAKGHLYGAVFCIKNRNVFDVMFIPAKQYIFTINDYRCLLSFLYNEFKNYERFNKFLSEPNEEPPAEQPQQRTPSPKRRPRNNAKQ